MKCGYKKPIIITSDGEQIFDIPASKQSNSKKIFHTMIEWQCETNWENMKNSEIRMKITKLRKQIASQQKKGDVALVIKAMTNYGN
jgi:hypothetical protein